MSKVTIEKYEDKGQEFKVGDIVEYTSDPENSCAYILICRWEDKEMQFSGIILTNIIARAYNCKIGTFSDIFNKSNIRKFRGKIIIEQE
jgi:hypothetical protein